MKSLAVALLVASFAVACARVQMPRPTELHAQSAQTRWPGVTVADLDRGRSLYVARCSSCHQPVPPTHIAPAEWPGHVQEMSERAHLDASEQRLVETYLVTMASK